MCAYNVDINAGYKDAQSLLEKIFKYYKAKKRTPDRIMGLLYVSIFVGSAGLGVYATISENWGFGIICFIVGIMIGTMLNSVLEVMFYRGLHKELRQRVSIVEEKHHLNPQNVVTLLLSSPEINGDRSTLTELVEAVYKNKIEDYQDIIENIVSEIENNSNQLLSNITEKTTDADATSTDMGEFLDRVERNVEKKKIKVFVFNEALDIGEKIARLGAPHNNATLLREANLIIQRDKLALEVPSDLDSDIRVGEININEVKTCGLSQNTIDAERQLIKPLMSALFVGLGFSLVIYFRFKDNLNFFQAIGISVPVIIIAAFFFIIFNTKRIPASHMAVMVITDKLGNSIDFGIPIEEVESIRTQFYEKGIEVNRS